MHTVRLYIDESLSDKELNKLKSMMMGMPHVTDVEYSRQDPHELAVEYEEHSGMPMSVVKALQKEGLHTDIISA